jgi:transcriptional regulator GlxA family with amidase domain
MTQPIKIVFALFPDVTQLDFTGPHQVLYRVPDAELTVASVAGGALRTDTGLMFDGLARLGDIAACDMICVPGGYGVTDALNDDAFLSEVRRLGLSARYVTSVCTGSLILAGAGLLRGRRAACHWAWRDLLTIGGAIPDSGRVVRDGDVITGGGVTAGIDFALTVAAELAGADAARRIQLAIEYDPAPPFDSGRPETAPPEVLAAVLTATAGQRAGREAAMRRACAVTA